MDTLTRPHGPPRDPVSRAWWPAMLALLGAALLLAGFNVRQAFEAAKAQSQGRLQAQTALLNGDFEAWLARQLAMATYLASSGQEGDWLRRVLVRPDAGARQPLQARLDEYARANDIDSVLLLDAAPGQVLLDGGTLAPPLAAGPLRDAVRDAVASGRPVHTGFYRDAQGSGAAPLRLDLVVPMLHSGSPARGVVVLRIDPQRVLLPRLQMISATPTGAQVQLWQRAGDQVLALGDEPPGPATHPAADPARRSGASWATAAWPAARALRGDWPAGQVLQADDEHGVAVLAVAWPLRGSQAWLVGQIEMRSVEAPAWRSAQWTLGVAALLLVGIGLASRVGLQRLRQARRERAADRQRLQALSLLEAVTNSASDAIFAKDLQGRYVFYNRAACEEVGRSRDQVLGRTDHDLFGAELADTIVAHDALVKTASGPQVFEELIPGPHGDRINLCAKGPLFDADGQLMGLFGVSRDMTEARRAERALRDSEAHYRAVVSVLTEGVVVHDPEGRVISCNPAAARLFGVSEARLLADGIVDSGWTPLWPDGSEMPPDSSPTGLVIAGATAQRQHQLAARRHDGVTVWFDCSAVPVHDPDTGALVAVVSTFSNVSDRKRAEDELARHRGRLEELVADRTAELQAANDSLARADRFIRTVTDNLPIRVAYWDVEQRCRYANRVFYDWYGKTPEQVIGRTAAEVFPSLHRSSAMALALQGQPQHFEREGRREDGRFFAQQVRYLPDLADDASVRGVYVIGFDITALKQAEAELRRVNADLAAARDEAESATRAKSAFLANMSHEIRTPMNAIIGLTHLMSRDSRDPQVLGRLGKVDDAARHLLQVINDILDLSKIEAGKMVLEDTEFSLDPLVARVFEMVRGRAGDKGLELVLDTDHLPERLRGDPTRLAQALLNLLSNAVKFTQRGFVRLRGELLHEDGARLQVRFEVQDTGEGIEADRQQRLFQAFEQADSSATRRHGGTGLGLALSRHLATMMGGEIGLTSTLGEGSTFWFTAWLGRAEAPPETVPQVPLRGLRALLVDDLAEARAALGDRLQLLGLQVDALASGSEALARVQRNMATGRPFDVMLVDWRMAPLDGLDTLRQLRALLGAGMPPSILATAYDDPTLRQQARDVGCDAVLLKPITASALHDTLVEVLRSSQRSTLIELPQPGASEAALRRQGAGRRLLLVEDNPVNQEVAAALLRLVGLSVDTASDGAQAVEQVLAQRYDLVLMDMQMPVMDGLTATRLIRERIGAALPIIAMTANAFGEDRQACLAAGMDDHVAKPVEPEWLFSTLLKWLPARVAADGVGATPTPTPTPTAAPAAAQRLQAPGSPRSLTDAPRPPLLERLMAVDGLDLADALQHVGGNLPLLSRVLTGFVEAYAQGDAGLQPAAMADGAGAVAAACHSLRGACAAIGANRLQQRLLQLEITLDHEPSSAALQPALRQLQADLLDLVRQLADVLRA